MQRLKRIIEYEKLGLTDRVLIRMGYNSFCYEERSSQREKLTENGRHFVMGLISVEQGFKIKYNYRFYTGSGSTVHYMSRVVRKPGFAYAKTKTQISFAVTAKLISAFVFATRIVQSLYFHKSEISSF